jgi:hypothetical protein
VARFWALSQRLVIGKTGTTPVSPAAPGLPMTVEFIEWTLFAAARSVRLWPTASFRGNAANGPFRGDCVAKLFFWGVCVQISAKALVCSLENYVGGFSHKQSDFQLAAFSSSLHGIVSSNGPLLFLRRSEIWALHH